MKHHICFKNWDGSSPGMESDIIVEGSSSSQEMHGLRYLKVIGDGDSSVYCRIKEKVSYGAAVQKIECANHAIKNYGKASYKLKTDTSINADGHKYLKNDTIKRLQAAAQNALRNCNEDVNILRRDLGKSIYHIFEIP